ncbi:MAG TPA: GMP synthase subunit A [Methanosphaera sp.]|nr:GMP synthase subunit A [Methanosphaera sp.]HII08442.1 GMP synthase subunit A [Methanosphaera sp.]HIJ15940.1 GMP synthase subunit A [Methanosphaera sp.]
MSIVIINNFGQYNHRISRTLTYLGIENKLVSNETSLDEIKSMNPEGIILGGGPSIDRIGNCEEIIKQMDVPILGICLGHQIIANVFGGETKSAEIESYAQIDLNIEKQIGIFEDVGDSLKVWASHKDEVITLPDDFEILASSTKCAIEAMKHKDKDIYGIQFHPEVQHTPRGGEIFENFYKLCKQ